MPDKSSAVSGAKACRAPHLFKKPAGKAGKSKASKLSTVRLFSRKLTNSSIKNKTKAYFLQGHLPTVAMTTSKLISQDALVAISLLRGVPKLMLHSTVVSWMRVKPLIRFEMDFQQVDSGFPF